MGVAKINMNFTNMRGLKIFNLEYWINRIKSLAVNIF